MGCLKLLEKVAQRKINDLATSVLATFTEALNKTSLYALIIVRLRFQFTMCMTGLQYILALIFYLLILKYYHAWPFILVKGREGF